MTVSEAERHLRRNIADNGGFDACAASDGFSDPTAVREEQRCYIACDCARDGDGRRHYSCLWLVGPLTVGCVRGTTVRQCARALAELLTAYGL